MLYKNVVINKTKATGDVFNCTRLLT